MIKKTLNKILEEPASKSFSLDTPEKLEAMTKEELLCRKVVKKATDKGSVEALDKIAELKGEKKVDTSLNISLGDTLQRFTNGRVDK